MTNYRVGVKGGYVVCTKKRKSSYPKEVKETGREHVDLHGAAENISKYKILNPSKRISGALKKLVS